MFRTHLFQGLRPWFLPVSPQLFLSPGVACANHCVLQERENQAQHHPGMGLKLAALSCWGFQAQALFFASTWVWKQAPLSSKPHKKEYSW